MPDKIKHCPFISTIIPVPKQMPMGLIKGAPSQQFVNVDFLPATAPCLHENCMFWDQNCLILEGMSKLCCLPPQKKDDENQEKASENAVQPNLINLK